MSTEMTMQQAAEKLAELAGDRHWIMREERKPTGVTYDAYIEGLRPLCWTFQHETPAEAVEAAERMLAIHEEAKPLYVPPQPTRIGDHTITFTVDVDPFCTPLSRSYRARVQGYPQLDTVPRNTQEGAVEAIKEAMQRNGLLPSGNESDAYQQAKDRAREQAQGREPGRTIEDVPPCDETEADA